MPDVLLHRRPGWPGRGQLGLAHRRRHEHRRLAGHGRDCSAFPTAGGLYYWASARRQPWGWFTGWFNLIGQIAVTAAIGYGLATFGTLLNFWFDYPNENEYIYLLYAIFLALARG